MEENKMTVKEFLKKHRTKILVGTGLICSAAVGYFLGANTCIWKRLEDGDWKFEIINNTYLKVSRIDPLTQKVRWYRFTGKDTKEIVDTLMDEYYPGD